MDTRKIAGNIVREELARHALRQEVAADRAGMAKSTLSKVLAGEVVQDLTLRQIEGLLGLPRRFLSYVIAADVDSIGAIESDPDLRRLALAALSDPGETVQRKRNGG